MTESDREIYEMFRDQIESEIPVMRYTLSLLKDVETRNESVNNLFRNFHNFKATAKYFSLFPLFNLTSKVEVVLNSLRESKQIIPPNIIDWLEQVINQITVWLDEMFEYQTELSQIPDTLNDKITLSKPYISPKHKLETLNILYFDENSKRSKQIVSYLKKISHNVLYSSQIYNLEYIFKMKNFDIIIMNLEKDNLKIIEYCNNYHITIPLITIFDKIDDKCSYTLMDRGINHIIKNPLNGTLLKNELHLIVNSYFTSINITINNDVLNEFIQSLEPLSNTVTQIIQICDDDEIPLKTLIKVIKSDPIMSGQILNYANSPLYGSISLRTIEQAIVRLGKNTIKALAFSNMNELVGSINLTPYKIDENIFSKVSMTRLSLMLKWYSKISIADLSILSSTALLGNIGQVLISKELLNLNQVELFQNMIETFGIKYAEESIVYTTTNIISSQILSYWQLSRAIINIVMYSDNPEDAPENIINLAVANHIVYRLVPLDGTILTEVPDDLLDIMAKYNLELDVLEKALKSIQTV